MKSSTLLGILICLALGGSGCFRNFTSGGVIGQNNSPSPNVSPVPQNPLVTGPPIVIPLTSSFVSSAVVVNSSYLSLPKDYSSQLVDSGGAMLQPNGISITTPNNSTNFAKVIFPLTLDPARTWFVNIRLRLPQIGPLPIGARIQTVVDGLRVSPDLTGELPWAVIDNRYLASGTDLRISIPLGLWSMRSSFTLAFQVQNDTGSQHATFFLDELTISSGNDRPASGIVRSNLHWVTEAERETAISGIAALGARWFRDGFMSPVHGVSDFVDVVRRVKNHNMKMLAVILQSPDDYPNGWDAAPNRGSQFQSICGWEAGSLPLSTIDLSRFETRIRAQFQAVKNAGLMIDAFEVGNELDWICFNGDVPMGTIATPAQRRAAAVAYAQFLKRAVSVIREPGLYPEAKILTFGITNAWVTNPSQDQHPNFRFQDSAQFISMLKNLDGVNYLDLVDAYGVHLYPDPNIAVSEGRAVLEHDVAALGTSKPLWITEWGFPYGYTNTSNNQFVPIYPLSNGSTRAQVINAFLDMLSSTPGVPIGPSFFYAYSSPSEFHALTCDVPSASCVGGLRPEAAVLGSRYRF